jgi:hypothetical protein
VYVKPSAPRNIGGVLDDSIRLYREGFKKTWPLALAAQLLIGVPTLLVRLKIAGSGMTNPQALLATYMSPGIWLPYLAGAIASIGFYNAIILQLSRLYQGEVLPPGRALADGYRLLPRVILLSLAFALCAIIIGVFFAVAFKASIGVRVVLSIVALPIAVYLMGRVYLTHVALIADDMGVFKSVETSWTLTRGRWWRGVTIYSVVALIAIVFYVVIGFVAGLITVAFGPSSAAGVGLTELVSVLGASVVFPLITAAVLSIYYDFQVRSEGSDLATRVNALAPQ